MSGHTPGPWAPDLTCGDVRSPVGDVAVAVFAGMRGIEISGRESTLAPITRVEAEANARLIAAAPDMLDALRDALAAAECAQRFPDYVTGRIRAAIAKATAP